MENNEQSLNQANQLIEMMQRQEAIKNLVPHILETSVLNAQILFKKFSDLQKEGFTEEQAMQIICTRPILE